MSLVRRLRQEEDGLGLSETVLAVVLASALLAMVASFFLTTSQTATDVAQTRDASATVANVSASMTSGIRFATQLPVRGQVVPDPAIVQATETSITLYSLVDTQSRSLTPILVRYSVKNGQWIEERWTGVTSADGFTTFGSATALPARQLGGVVVPQTGADNQPFVYLDKNGSAVAPGGSLSATVRSSIASVRINLALRSSESSAAPVTFLTNTVGMPNLTYVQVTS